MEESIGNKMTTVKCPECGGEIDYLDVQNMEEVYSYLRCPECVTLVVRGKYCLSKNYMASF